MNSELSELDFVCYWKLQRKPKWELPFKCCIKEKKERHEGRIDIDHANQPNNSQLRSRLAQT